MKHATIHTELQHWLVFVQTFADRPTFAGIAMLKLAIFTDISTHVQI